jgi:hypothetical protein
MVGILLWLTLVASSIRTETDAGNCFVFPVTRFSKQSLVETLTILLQHWPS